MNGRVQNPLWGRMLSPDPVLADLELPQGLNPYSYVGNNPASRVDPTGLTAEIIVTGRMCAAMCDPGDIEAFAREMQARLDEQAGRILERASTAMMARLDAAAKGVQAVVSARLAAAKAATDKAIDWLCQKGTDNAGQRIVDAADNVSTAADAARPLVAVGAAAAGVNRSGFSPGAAYLGNEMAGGLAKLGSFGKVTGAFGVTLNLANGDIQGALFSSIDYFVFSGLASVGAAGAVETLGASAAMAGGTIALYYSEGGSRGLVQSALDCN